MSIPIDPFTSPNLLYRAIESPDHDALFTAIQLEPADFISSNARLLHPQSRADASAYQKDLIDNSLLAVAICLPTHTPDANPTPIGVIFLKPTGPKMVHHRNSEIGIDILKGYQGKGYGTEAIEWCLEWAFRHAGLHRVAIRAFEWNLGARRLYERLGFRLEGVAREELWLNGKWWDGYCYGILEGEWRERREGTEGKEGV